MKEKDGNGFFGCQIDDENPTEGEATCFMEVDGKKYSNRYKTDLTGDKLISTPQGRMEGPDQDPAMEQQLNAKVASRLPYMQKFIELEKDKGGE
jgi:hypothetical protein